MKIWIYIADKRKFRQLDKDDKRFDWDYPHAPEGRVKFQFRKPSRQSEGWHYVCWGVTQQQACDHYNWHTRESIKKLEGQLASLRAQLIQPEEGHG